MQMLYKNKIKHQLKGRLLGALLMAYIPTFAAAPKPSDMDNTLAVILVIIAGALLLAIVMLGYVLSGAAELYMQRKKEQDKATATALKTLIVIGFCVISSAVWAQDATATITESPTINGLSKFSFYTLVCVISLELIVILVMAYYVNRFIAKEKVVVAVKKIKANRFSWLKFWQKINSFKPQSQEQDIMTNHDYDGIRELDNQLPRWWVWGFVFTVVFAFGYLYRFQVAHSAPNPEEEFEIAMKEAEAQKLEYLAHAASKVDENSVVIITDATSIEEGRKMFVSTCAPCHGERGQGVVGPNLTDDYWLHGGSINDVFKTIKYGYPEKGMKSWKDDFAPTQLAKLASYVKTLHGTNPINAKEPQGDLYKDIIAPQKDSANLPAKKHEELSAESKEAAL